jgi:drug/metabolite transporter (DMT)-like permease
MLLLLIIPSLFDLFATALCMFGLRYVDVSMYQMLRGGAIIFVALLKQFVIGHKLFKYQWVGVFWNVMSIVVVGCTALLSEPGVASDDTKAGQPPAQAHYDHPLTGVILILLGAFVQSLQYAFEEKVMNMDIPAPPMLLIGMEGLWGTLLCLFCLYPLVYSLPGPDHGSIENPYNTYVMFMNSSEIQGMFVVFFVSVFLYNVLGVLVTCVLNSVWHAILDNFRPVSVWGTDLFIYYRITHAFGETWTRWSYLQLAGMFVLLYGTAIYNAPNTGSIELRGQWFGCYLDFSQEYEEMEENVADGTEVAVPLSTMSPFMTPRSAAAKKGYSSVPADTATDYGSTGQPVKSIQLMKKQTSFNK